MPTPPTKREFSQEFDDLQVAIDVDASDGRNVPINMNFVDEGYLTKDTGFTLFGITESDMCHSLYYYKKQNGIGYVIRGKGTKLQSYNFFDRTWTDIVGSPTFTEGAEFGFIVYDDLLYGCNASEDFFTWDGASFQTFSGAPKGNILEVFEDKVFVAGVTVQPLSVYYSNTGIGTAFTSTDVIKPLGTDSITGLKNYYGSLLIFKQDSIWKMTFQYDQIVNLFVPKLDIQSGNYGACSRKAITWVENELWFFTGREVRAIGFTDNVSGVFGINKSTISENIKETLKRISIPDFSKCVTFYNNRRFYLGVPIGEDYANTIFVCHTLYKNSWTKYTGRDKSNVNDFVVVDDIIYTNTSAAPFGSLKWTVETEDSQDLNYSLATE